MSCTLEFLNKQFSACLLMTLQWWAYSEVHITICYETRAHQSV